jgi:hypothetical protein
MPHPRVGVTVVWCLCRTNVSCLRQFLAPVPAVPRLLVPGCTVGVLRGAWQMEAAGRRYDFDFALLD